MVLLYIPIFKTILYQLLLKLLIYLNKTMKSQNLTTDAQFYAMMNNLLEVEVLKYSNIKYNKLETTS